MCARYGLTSPPEEGCGGLVAFAGIYERRLPSVSAAERMGLLAPARGDLLEVVETSPKLNDF